MQNFLVCRIEEIEIGIEREKILEIVEKREITFLPLKSKILKGMFNVRGNILPFFDIIPIISKSSFQKEYNYFVIVESEKGRKGGIGVHEIIGNLEVKKIDEKSGPGALSEEVEKNFIKGVIDMNGKLIFILDVEKFMEMEEVL